MNQNLKLNSKGSNKMLEATLISITLKLLGFFLPHFNYNRDISTKVQFLYKYHVFRYNEIGQGKLNLQHQHMITLKF
jgi:hypothetical protein